LALSLTDPALAIAPLVKNSNTVIEVVAAQLRAARAADDTPAHLDPDLEAFGLLAMSAGLGTSVLGGQSSPGQAQAIIDYHLDRLFSASGPALQRAPMKGAAMSRWALATARPVPGGLCSGGRRTGQLVPGSTARCRGRGGRRRRSSRGRSPSRP